MAEALRNLPELGAGTFAYVIAEGEGVYDRQPAIAGLSAKREGRYRETLPVPCHYLPRQQVTVFYSPALSLVY